MNKPRMVPNTSRQTLKSASGQVLERSYLYMLPSTWIALRGLCIASNQPSSTLIESLIIAASGIQKGINESTRNH